MQISVRSQTAAQTTLSWQPVAGAARYRILWSDRPGETVRFKTAGESGESLFTFCRSTHIPYYIKVQALAENGTLLEESTPVQTPRGPRAAAAAGGTVPRTGGCHGKHRCVYQLAAL